MSILEPEFWTALLKIIGVNIVLSGDNAVVIALAARSLPVGRQQQAVFWGSGAAIFMRIVLTFFAAVLLGLPWLKLVGAALLLWIGVKLLVPGDEGPNVEASDNLRMAIRTILIADLVMSLDNVIAVAAAAGGEWGLMIIGLAISIPLVIFGATLLIRVMERWPVIVAIGAGLLGFVAGEMAWEDAAIAGLTRDAAGFWKYAVALAGAAFVVIVGRMIAGRDPREAEEERMKPKAGNTTPNIRGDNA
jgi:YjbE family integral membrane protein